jgi:hypothetical protein
MQPIRKVFLNNIFYKNEHIYICRDEFSKISQAVDKLSAIRLLSFKTSDNTSYEDMLNSCCEESKNIVNLLCNKGFRIWGLVIGPVLSKERMNKINNYSVFNPLNSRGLSGSINREKCYELPEGVRHAGVFEINTSKFFEACLFISQTVYSLIIISNRDDFILDKNIDRLFFYGAFDNNKVATNHINWRAITVISCPHGDLVAKVSGAFDDEYRALNFIYCPSTINQELRDVLEKAG